MAADVRVRLSAEGVAEVVGALQKIRSESTATAVQGARSFTQFGGAINGVKGILGQLGLAVTIAAAVGQLVSFAQGGVKAADAMQRFRSQTGGSIENLTALKLAAADAELSLEDVVNRMRVVNQVTSAAARAPRGEAAAPLRAIGLSPKAIGEFVNQDAVERIATIGRAFADLPPSVDRANAAVAIFGRTGAELLPLLEQLGRQGIPNLVARARELGLVLDDEVVAAAAAVDDSFDTVSAQAGALATQFAAGFSVPIRQAVAAVSQQVSSMGRTWQEVGQIIGFVLKTLIFLGTSLLNISLTSVKTIADGLGLVVRVIKRLATGDLDGAGRALTDFGHLFQKSWTDAFGRIGKSFRATFTEKPPTLDAAPKAVASANDELADLYRERFEIRRAALDRELRQARASAKLAADEEDAAFDRRLKTVQEHYDARRRIVNEAANTEKEILVRTRNLEASRPVSAKRDQTLEGIDDQIAEVERAREVDLSELTGKQEADVRRIGQEQIRILLKIRELRGDQHAETLREIEEETRKAKEAFDAVPRAGFDSQEIADEIRSLLERRQALEDIAKTASSQLDAFGRDRSAIEARADAGLISQLQAEQQILALERSRVETLRTLGQALLQTAQESKDPQRIADAQEFLDSVAGIEISVSAAEDVMARFGATAVDATNDALVSFLTFEQGASGAVRGIILALERLAAQIVATKVISGILSAFGGGGGGLSFDQEFSFAQVTGRRRGGVVGLAGGGRVSGPGTGTSDSIFAVSFPSKRPYALSDGEHVVREAAARRPQIRSALNRLNFDPQVSLAELAGLPDMIRSQASMTVTDNVSVRGLAAGGVVGDIEPGAALRGTPANFGGSLEISLSPELLADRMAAFIESPRGQRAQIRTLAKYRHSANRVLGGG